MYKMVSIRKRTLDTRYQGSLSTEERPGEDTGLVTTCKWRETSEEAKHGDTSALDFTTVGKQISDI